MGTNLLDDCVNETVVLDTSCHAKPEHSDFFPLLHQLINEDTDLIVLHVSISNTNISQRFDMVQTAFGETLLTLKSQMEFMTVQLPLLSHRIHRKHIKLVHYPQGCVYNATDLETTLKNWLLCGLAIRQLGDENVYNLLVKKLCIAKQYEEPDDWFLFKDTYYHVCCDEASRNSTCHPLVEDMAIAIFKKTLNFGVSSAAILSMIVLFVYRGLFCAKAHIFLYKLHKANTKICKIVESTVGASNLVQLFPITARRLDVQNCAKYIKNGKLEDQDANRLSRKAKEMEKGQPYQVQVSGYWFDIDKDVLISYNSFGLIFFLKVFMDECSAKNNCKDSPGFSVWKSRCCIFGRYTYYFIDILISVAIVFVGCYFLLQCYKSDPFHTLLDGIACVVLVFFGTVSIIGIKSTLGFCDNKVIDIIQTIVHEMVFFFLSYSFVAMFARMIVILLIGLAFQSSANVYTLVASAAFFVVSNGYYQLWRTHKRYLHFFKACMEHISSSLEEDDTFSDPVYKGRLVPSETKNDVIPGKHDNTLVLKLDKRFQLYYTENGEPAINLNFFLGLCKSDTHPSPGNLKSRAFKELVKFVFWSFVVAVVIYLQHIIAQTFDYSLYEHAPATIVSGLLPTLFTKVLFPEQKIEKDANLARLLNDSVTKYEKEFVVTDLEITGDPDRLNVDEENSTQEEDVWDICINRKTFPCTKCCCISGEEVGCDGAHVDPIAIPSREEGAAVSSV